jgi:hypothetical protein
MDRETAMDVRDLLIAMWGIVRVWQGVRQADSVLALDWLKGLMGQVLEFYPVSGPLHSAFRGLGDYLADASLWCTPEEMRPHLASWLLELVEALEVEFCLPRDEVFRGRCERASLEMSPGDASQ